MITCRNAMNIACQACHKGCEPSEGVEFNAGLCSTQRDGEIAISVLQDMQTNLEKEGKEDEEWHWNRDNGRELWKIKCLTFIFLIFIAYDHCWFMTSARTPMRRCSVGARPMVVRRKKTLRKPKIRSGSEPRRWRTQNTKQVAENRAGFVLLVDYVVSFLLNTCKRGVFGFWLPRPLNPVWKNLLRPAHVCLRRSAVQRTRIGYPSNLSRTWKQGVWRWGWEKHARCFVSLKC